LGEFGQALVDGIGVDADALAARLGASKLISSSRCSITVARRRAPMFSVRSLTSKAICARRCTPSGVTSSVTPSVASRAWYCLIRLAWVLVRMASKSATESELSSTRIGKATLQFGDQVARPGQGEGAAGDEQHVVGLDRPVFGADGRAFDQRQQVALHALAGDFSAAAVLA
jgi:hypothetical protein